MKHKMLPTVMALVLACSLFGIAPPKVPISASTLAWGAETIVSTTDNILAPSSMDIVSMAVNGDTIYVVTGTTTTDNITYKSTNAGATWSSLVSTVDYPNSQNKLVAVAPDDANVVAIVTNTNNVYYSTNGGSSWSNLGLPTGATAILDIDISPVVAGVRYVAAVGVVGGPAGELWTMKLAMAETWTARMGAGGFVTSTAINAVKFSPNFASDKIVLCVTESAPVARLQVFRLETGLLKWNGQISWYGTDWNNGAVIDNITGQITAASIAITPAYVGSDLGTRLLYVGLATAGEGGVYRVNDIVSKKFETWSGGDPGKIYSVAYHSSGKLLAGKSDSSTVYVCLTPTASTPQFERTTNYKQPGGTGNVIVAWSGNKAVAGTRGDESAFAVSTDNGATFNDISLIDTTLATMTDFAIDSAGTKWYLATYSGNDVSIWLKDTTWFRVFSLRDAGSLTYLIRLAPTDYKTIYLAQQGGTQMWLSKDAGKASWKDISVYGMTTLQDIAVQSADIAYVIDASGCVKTTNAGTSWGEKKTLDTIVGHTIALAPNNDVLVGGSDGLLSFSKDGGATFTKTKMSGGAGTNVYVAADDAYATNNIVHRSGHEGLPRQSRYQHNLLQPWYGH